MRMIADCLNATPAMAKALLDRPVAPASYGQRDTAGMYRQIEALRQAIWAEGSPAIQAAWDAVEEFIDFSYGRPPTVAGRPILRTAPEQPAAPAAGCFRSGDPAPKRIVRHGQ